ncbi:hypothetical protein WM32_08560 [Burkholderia ubonensis]|nr:hypothetical protein WM32_08560 [Burkholderia ubonensis]
MLTAKTILDDFDRLGLIGSDSMQQTLQLRRQDSGALVDLVMGALDRALQSTTFIDTALDLMDDASFDKVAREAWRMGRDGRWSEVLADVLDAAALQSPAIFVGDWDRLLNLSHAQQGRRLYQRDAAWRALDLATVSDWRRQLGHEQACDGTGRERAIALLHSRRSEAVHDAWTRLFPEETEQARAWLMSAGYALENGELRALHTESPLHIDFGQNSLSLIRQEMPAWKREIHENHPTWRAGGADRLHARVGGVLPHRCGLCHGPLHQLLALQQPNAAGIASRTPIAFGTCLSCLGWEGDGGPLFYRHDDEGRAYQHPSQQCEAAVTPEFTAAALRDAEVELFAAPTRWSCQDWGASNHRQNLSRVGGGPSWVQSAWYPECPDCGCRMRFVMQLDSGLPQADGDEWLWGSGSANYTFWCETCRTSAHLWQCT